MAKHPPTPPTIQLLSICIHRVNRKCTRSSENYKNYLVQT